MDALDVARWQFGIVTVYHFLFVPLTIGLAPIVAIMQTAWHRTGKDSWLRLTHFFGKLLLINFALGVVTGIVAMQSDSRERSCIHRAERRGDRFTCRE